MLLIAGQIAFDLWVRSSEMTISFEWKKICFRDYQAWWTPLYVKWNKAE